MNGAGTTVGVARYRCLTERCVATMLFADGLPVRPQHRGGVLVCPLCAHPVGSLPDSEPVVVFDLSVNAAVVAQLVVETGVGLVIGRWGGERALPLDDLVGVGPASRVSRRHLRLDVAPLGVFVHDLGSSNGTWLRLGDSHVRLSDDACVMIGPGITIELPGAITIALSPMTDGGPARPTLSIAELTSDATKLDGDVP